MENFKSASNEAPVTKTPERDMGLNPLEGVEDAARLEILLEKYKDKRVLVVGPPGAGKSTLLQHLKNGIDIDNALFDTMPKVAKDFALQRENPYMLTDSNSKGYQSTLKYSQKEFVPGDEKSEEGLTLSSDFLQTYVNAHTKIEEGKPFFATNVIDADVIIYLRLDNETYKRRIESRSAKTNRPLQIERNLRLKDFIERDIEIARGEGVIVEEFEII